jgi:hypothetical protein
MASKWARRPTRPLRLADITVKLTMPYKAMEMTLWLSQAEIALAAVEGH